MIHFKPYGIFLIRVFDIDIAIRELYDIQISIHINYIRLDKRSSCLTNLFATTFPLKTLIIVLHKQIAPFIN